MDNNTDFKCPMVPTCYTLSGSYVSLNLLHYIVSLQCPPPKKKTTGLLLGNLLFIYGILLRIVPKLLLTSLREPNVANFVILYISKYISKVEADKDRCSFSPILAVSLLWSPNLAIISNTFRIALLPTTVAAMEHCCTSAKLTLCCSKYNLQQISYFW